MFGLSDINSHDNKNPKIDNIYPVREAGDAPYENKEERLRAAIFIPKEFKYGKDGKSPVLLVPGTGTYGGTAYQSNFAKLLKNSSFGDPVWLNVPGAMNEASHSNAEHVAYAINYLSIACKKSLAVVAWSQGNLATQWSLKYWPSTRAVVNNFIALSADFAGTWQASVVMPFKLGVGNPSMWSQRQHSQFIQALRDDGGDSAYVPTTSVYSRTDEVVQPQWGDNASARIKDERGVGARNYELQKVAPMTPAGFWFSHSTVLSNPITWALAEDAITNGGPGKIERLDIKALSSRWVAHGLNNADGLATEAQLASAGSRIAAYLWKVLKEPEVPVYALSKMKAPIQKVNVEVTDKPPLEQIPPTETPPPALEAAAV